LFDFEMMYEFKVTAASRTLVSCCSKVLQTQTNVILHR